MKLIPAFLISSIAAAHPAYSCGVPTSCPAEIASAVEMVNELVREFCRDTEEQNDKTTLTQDNIHLCDEAPKREDQKYEN